MSRERKRYGNWPVRFMAAFGTLLVVLGSFGWWMSTRVLDADGFADVVAKASDRVAVRDYIADQATLKLAPTSNFVSAARPVVTDAISAAIATPPVREAIYDFAYRAHRQVFQVAGAQRVDVDSAQAAITIRSALEVANPSLAKKLPANVLDATTTISQSDAVDTLFKVSRWVDDLWLPTLLLGIGLLVFAVFKARDRVHAIRIVGVSMAVGGALLLGVSAATPAFAIITATADVGRGEAISTFIEVLVGRLAGAGKAMLIIGLLLALAPGHDGGDLRSRWERLRNWVTAKRQRTAWRVAGGAAIITFGVLALTVPVGLFGTLLDLAALLVVYVGIVVILRALKVMVTDHTIPKLHKRQVFAVFAILVGALLFTGTAAASLLASAQTDARADPTNEGCNNYLELCPMPINQVLWPASHNAMSSAAYDFFSAEHILTVPEQLNAGVRFFMLDAYYGYDDQGLVRTNLTGGLTKEELRKERGPDAVRELDRLNALTGVADTSGKKQDLYFCHDYCELGAVRAEQVFEDIDAFLDRNLTDVVILDLEDYVKPKDVKKTLIESGLWDRVYRLKPGQYFPTLQEMVTPHDKDATENPRRVILMSEKHGGEDKWLPGTYALSQETPFTFDKISQFNCDVNRGGTNKPFFVVNHWLRPNGPPDPVEAGSVNDEEELLKRLQQCTAQRNALVTALAVDFTSIGDIHGAVAQYNAAIAKVSGVSATIDKGLKILRNKDDLTDAQLREITGYSRLPKITLQEAQKLLGPMATRINRPADLAELVQLPDSLQTPATRGQATTTTVPDTIPDGKPKKGQN
ncbi:MAG: hypothetical protein U0W40_17100 [Acidimicrobiia bacterium]